LALQRNYKYIFLNGFFNSRTAKDPDFIYIENNNDNIDFFELSDVNSVNILESLNIPEGRSQFTNTFVISNPSIHDK
jgi:hypothetical protein